MRIQLTSIFSLIFMPIYGKHSIPEFYEYQTSYPSLHAYKDDFNDVYVTFVGNSGFLITVGDKKILIDALFKKSKVDCDTPQNVQEMITLGQPPFDSIDLILVTHCHKDHFDERLVRQYMTNNPNTIFASTPQATEALTDFLERVITFYPTKKNSECKEIHGINVEAIYLSNGITNVDEPRIINFGFIITLNGVKLFHMGNFNMQQFGFKEIKPYQLPERKIDVVFIQHFYLTDKSLERKFIYEGIGSRFIIPSHYHFISPPIDTVKIQKNYPKTIAFKKELQSWAMPNDG